MANAQRKYNRFMRLGESVADCDCEHCTQARQQVRGGLREYAYPKNKRTLTRKLVSGPKVIEFPGIVSLTHETKSLTGETRQK